MLLVRDHRGVPDVEERISGYPAYNLSGALPAADTAASAGGWERAPVRGARRVYSRKADPQVRSMFGWRLCGRGFIRRTVFLWTRSAPALGPSPDALRVRPRQMAGAIGHVGGSRRHHVKSAFKHRPGCHLVPAILTPGCPGCRAVDNRSHRDAQCMV